MYRVWFYYCGERLVSSGQCATFPEAERIAECVRIAGERTQNWNANAFVGPNGEATEWDDGWQSRIVIESANA